MGGVTPTPPHQGLLHRPDPQRPRDLLRHHRTRLELQRRRRTATTPRSSCGHTSASQGNPVWPSNHFEPFQFIEHPVLSWTLKVTLPCGHQRRGMHVTSWTRTKRSHLGFVCPPPFIQPLGTKRPGRRRGPDRTQPEHGKQRIRGATVQNGFVTLRRFGELLRNCGIDEFRDDYDMRSCHVHLSGQVHSRLTDQSTRGHELHDYGQHVDVTADGLLLQHRLHNQQLGRRRRTAGDSYRSSHGLGPVGPT